MSASYKSTKIACFVGFVVQAIINNFLPLLFIIFNTQYGLNYEELGRLLFVISHINTGFPSLLRAGHPDFRTGLPADC